MTGTSRRSRRNSSSTTARLVLRIRVVLLAMAFGSTLALVLFSERGRLFRRLNPPGAVRPVA